ncbi:metal-sulfur cluster biosynthetic enzyme [Halostagnicola sp. A56]|uniref:iron-sulfur cluster assembly protein n=1 Tax=Halostagnicola sp. A56 TaxID=1495067 RepID=UPI00049EB77A|nr:iron-sulfur cluster assembly protein [Halostagnicola sp. A56]KDE60290.1 metal-sulfur cluster biosynthetic enzyme [Halostagnicola sp. A56]
MASNSSTPHDASNGPDRATVCDRLRRVTDPELDRSIVELEYVDEIEIDGPRVTVRFTLPTAWCSPAFAWMMATEARDAVEALSNVETVEIVLQEHLHETEINRGVNERRSFEASFPDADGGIEDVRAQLDEKARVARQYDAIEALLGVGLEPARIVSLRRRDVECDKSAGVAAVELSDRGFTATAPIEPIESYLEKARETGVGTHPDDILFRTPEGEPIDPDDFELVHRRGRLAQVNMSGQGGICDALNESRRARFEGDD